MPYFAVTNYWETRSAETEIKQGKAMADAAKVCILLTGSDDPRNVANP